MELIQILRCCTPMCVRQQYHLLTLWILRDFDRKEESYMKKRHVYNLAILLAAGTILMSACGKKTEAPADTAAPTQTESQTEISAEETSKTEETQIPTDTEDTENSKFYMLQGTITKVEKAGSAFTLQADDGKEYAISVSDISDVETQLEKDTQIAIACMKDASGDPEKASYIAAFPEQEEWTISTAEGVTTSNAMGTFMIQTADGRELGFIKDGCPSYEDALSGDSGDSVIVTYVTSDNANFPLEIRKGK